MANLLQVSSAFGRAMETVDRTRCADARLSRRCWSASGPAPTERELRTVIAAAAEGYPFPTNLDLDQPIGGLNPETQAELTWRALGRELGPAALSRRAPAQHARHQSG